MLDYMEIHPVNTKVVCLNQPHLQLSWIYKALSKTLGCRFNPHQLQVVWCPGDVCLPKSRTYQLRGHASHTLPTNATPVITSKIQTGTYLVFHIPKKARSFRRSCQLILNGVESVIEKTKNPSQFKIHLIKSNQEAPSQDITETNNSINQDQHQLESSNTSPKKKLNKEDSNSSTDAHFVASEEEMLLDFDNTDSITMLVEEELSPSAVDDSDSSDDIHKIVRKQLTADIQPLFTSWQASEEDLFVLLLKPSHQFQAWQFLSVWLHISVNEAADNSQDINSTSAMLKMKRKGLTRTKPISSTTHNSKKNNKDQVEAN